MRKLLRRRYGRRAGVRLTLVLLTALSLGAAAGAAGPRAAAGKHDPFSIRITSPVGRSGLPGTVRIVARPEPAEAPPATVRFFVDGDLIGEDTDGPPYVNEWVDVNPFEACRVAVEATSTEGVLARDEVLLEPFEIVDTTEVMSVAVDASVLDGRGRPVRGLDAEAFELQEDGVRQRIDTVGADPVPTVFALLVDSSESMRPRVEEVRHAVGGMVDLIGGNDRLVIAPFKRGITHVTGPTRDRQTLTDAIAAIEPAGGTAIFDSLTQVVGDFADGEGQRIVLLVTDGYDEHSQGSPAAALERLRASRATVFVIAVGGIAGVSLKGERVLRDIARATGGEAYFPWNEQQLAEAHQKIASAVGDRYLITYTPADQRQDGRWRDITVTTTDPGHRIRARRGYRAPAPAPVRATLEFTATNLAREYVELSLEELEVLEDGVPQEVDAFQEATLPVSIVMALDASGSMKRAATTVRAAAAAFVQALRPEDRLAVTTFADAVQTRHELTSTRAPSLAAIAAYTAAGGTALNDALLDSLLRLREVEGRRALVVVTDGRDENAASNGPGSAGTWPEVLGAADEVDAVIYAIGLGSGVDRERLQTLARRSGGEAFFSADVEELGAEYRRVVEELRRRYVVSYTSSNSRRDGKWRSVEVRSRREAVRIRSRGGYFAPGS